MGSWVSILRGLRSLKMQSKLLITGMLLALAMFFTPTDGTVALTVTSGATTVLALTAAQVTGLAALKLLGVTAGALVARNRGKREDESNLVEPRSLVELTAQLEPEACYQLLFCALADETIKVDKDVEAVKKLVISSPGKYKEAHKFGLAGKKCSLRYKCSISAKEIIQFYQSY